MSMAGNTILEFCQDGKAVICTAETFPGSSGTLRIILDICQKWRFQTKMDGDNRQ